MKKLFNYAIVLLAGLTVALSCSKIEKEIDNPVVEPETEVVSIPVTVMATLPDVDTKVAFEATFDAASKPTAMKRTWEASDKLRVIDSTNPSMYEDLDLESGDGTPTAVFHGNLKFTASSYNVEVVEAQAHTTSYGVQTQAANGDTNHLQFVASATGVTDLTSAITLNETSGVLGIIAQMPAAATDIESVEIVNMSTNASVVKINLTNPAVGTDPVLKLFANVSAGWTWAAGEYFIRFNAPSTAAHTVYTRYYNLASDVVFGTQASGVGEYRPIKLNCSHTDQHAGPATADGSTAEKAYLIADKYQLQAMGSLMEDSATKYFKLLCNIDLLGETWVAPNNAGSFAKGVDFDGNNKTISNLTCSSGAYPSFIGVLNGSIKDLVFENATITAGSNVAGVLAGYIGSSSASVSGTCSGITVNNSTVTGSKRGLGGMAGYVSKLSAPVSDCHVNNTSVTSTADRVGGLAGQTEKNMEVNNCSANGITAQGTTNIGGLVGVHYGKAINCTSSGTIVSSNTTKDADIALGGIAGYFQNGLISKCSSSVNINQTTNGRDIGGLVGKMLNATTLEKSFATGNVKGIQRNVGGLVGLVSHTSDPATISDCYCTGSVDANSYCGGLIGLYEKGDLTITNCYSSSIVNVTSFAVGGLIGVVGTADLQMSKSAAWNPSVTAVSIGSGNWSSAAVVAVAFPSCTLTDNYRNPSMALTAYWGNTGGYTVALAADYSQPNVSGSAHLTDSTGAVMTDASTSNNSANPHYPQYPYQGKVEAGKTLSELASTTLGWDASIWDFTGDLPTLN
jgi:hypothetical protein